MVEPASVEKPVPAAESAPVEEPAETPEEPEQTQSMDEAEQEARWVEDPRFAEFFAPKKVPDAENKPKKKKLWRKGGADQ